MLNYKVHPPSFRRLRGFAYDPGVSMQLETAVINHLTFQVPWEKLDPGPKGEYLEVIDYDPPSECFYAPVNLDDPHLLAQDGLAPSEGNPQFHQQMVYAVAMTTIKHFERALGRLALWASGPKYGYVRRLRIYPHALREANAYYSRDKKALLFGYFPASDADPGRNLPGGMVFTCLSHDIVAHETTHALLDGLHRRFGEPTNPDVLAFHEAFADIVALFQHFSYREAVRHQIGRTRGDLAKQNMLGELARQFGEAIGQRGALRNAITTGDPDPADYQTKLEPHDRGAILVAAVFDAFLSIYKTRVGDLLRIATSGTGVLPEGEIHPDLVNRLADEANKSARHVLAMCIRALDYCPPVDVTFGDYLRALITADQDLVADDDRGYRLAVVEAFRRRGIYPRDVRSLASDALVWRGSDFILPASVLRRLSLGWDLSVKREEIFNRIIRRNGRVIHDWLVTGDISAGKAEEMGLALGKTAGKFVQVDRQGKPVIEVHSVRPARRVSPDGELVVDMVIELTQKRKPENGAGGWPPLRGGCTLIVSPETGKVRYCVSKRIQSENRLRRMQEFLDGSESQSLYATYFGDPRRNPKSEPFAAVHRGF